MFCPGNRAVNFNMGVLQISQISGKKICKNLNLITYSKRFFVHFMWGLGEPIGRQLGIKCFLVGGIFCRNQAFSTCCAILCKCGSLFCGCCKNSECLIISELQCFVELISPPEKMFQNYKSKEDNVISFSFCVVLLGSVAPAV